MVVGRGAELESVEAFLDELAKARGLFCPPVPACAY
jgi:hypothetical protein